MFAHKRPWYPRLDLGRLRVAQCHTVRSWRLKEERREPLLRLHLLLVCFGLYIFNELVTGTSAEAAPAAPPLVSSYVLSDIEQPAAVPDPSEDVKVACVYKHGGWTLHL